MLQLRRWLSLLEGPIDLAYTTTLQPRGNAHIVHSRAAVLGGCSSHNTQIFFKPFPGDWQDWVDRGARGWEPEGDGEVLRAAAGQAPIVAEKDRNALLPDWIPAGGEAAGVQANPTGTRGRSTTAPASWTSATTRRRASARRPASPTCTRSWASART